MCNTCQSEQIEIPFDICETCKAFKEHQVCIRCQQPAVGQGFNRANLDDNLLCYRCSGATVPRCFSCGIITEVGMTLCKDCLKEHIW